MTTSWFDAVCMQVIFERAPRAHFAGCLFWRHPDNSRESRVHCGWILIGILNNPSIWSYIVANASGSITRRIKWKDLANYEFLLPPKDQQAEIAELLCARSTLQLNRCSRSSRKVKTSLKAIANELFGKMWSRICQWRIVPVIFWFPFKSKQID